MDISVFRNRFPEFQDTALYPNEMIAFWSEIAETMVVPRRWKNMTEKGIMLYTAHELTIASKNYQTGNSGGSPGQMSGPLNSKTVGSVTAAYDTQQTAEKDAGWWNLTTYGKQFYRLQQMFGAGAVQLI